jgi:predicted amidophosphoribosyltransferase
MTVFKAGRRLLEGLLQLVYPAACGACEGALEPGRGPFCAPCLAALTSDPYPACPRCASTVGPHALVDGGCSRCRTVRFHFQQAVRLGQYEGLLRELILRLKQPAGEALARGLADVWSRHCVSVVQRWNVDFVIPVPLHWRRQQVWKALRPGVGK